MFTTFSVFTRAAASQDDNLQPSGVNKRVSQRGRGRLQATVSQLGIKRTLNVFVAKASWENYLTGGCERSVQSEYYLHVASEQLAWLLLLFLLLLVSATMASLIKSDSFEREREEREERERGGDKTSPWGRFQIEDVK